MRYESLLLMAAAIGLMSVPLMAAPGNSLTATPADRMAGGQSQTANPAKLPDINIYRQLSFSQFDVNGDGIVNPSEFVSGNPGIKGVLNDFVRLDADNNGGLTREEFRNAGLDAGQLGIRDAEDTDVVLNRDPDSTRRQPIMSDSGNSFEAKAHQDLEETLRLDELDRDGDSVVTKEEFLAEVKTEFNETIFNRIDIDNDGRITRNELETAGLAAGMLSRDVNDRRQTR